MAKALTEKHPAGLVCSVAFVRIVVEVILQAVSKAAYTRQGNPGVYLSLASVFMTTSCIILHCINRLGLPLFPALFGGEAKWRQFNVSAFLGLLPATLCFTSSLVLKQFILAGSGPGYLEMLGSIGVPIAGLMQFFINGTRIGKIGVASCVVGFLCWATCIPLLPLAEPLSAVVAHVLKTFRNSWTKRSNAKHKLPPGLNIVYTGLMAGPIYMATAIYLETCWIKPTPDKAWSNAFHLVQLTDSWQIMLPYPDVWGFCIFSLCSNLCVFAFLDIASPLTFTIAGALGGLIQTVFDIFYIDHMFMVLMFDLFGIDSSGLERIKNKTEWDTRTWAPFLLKCLYVGLYCLEKSINQYQIKKELKSKKLPVVEE